MRWCWVAGGMGSGIPMPVSFLNPEPRTLRTMKLALESKADWTEAIDHLSHVDPKLAEVIERAGPCTLKPGGDCFIALSRAIIAQQISGVVAKAITKRFKKLFSRSRPTPK